MNYGSVFEKGERVLINRKSNAITFNPEDAMAVVKLHKKLDEVRDSSLCNYCKYNEVLHQHDLSNKNYCLCCDEFCYQSYQEYLKNDRKYYHDDIVPVAIKLNQLYGDGVDTTAIKEMSDKKEHITSLPKLYH